MGSIRNCVEKAKQELEYFSNDKDYWFNARANDAVKEFNCREILIKKNECITLDSNGRWYLPCGFKQVLAIVGEQMTNNGVPMVSPIVYFDTPFLHSCGINSSSPPGATWLTYQQNGSEYLQFYGNYTAFINLKIAFLSYNVDEYGTFYIPEDFELPITYYLCMMWALKHNRDYNQMQYNEWKNLYYAQKRRVVSESNQVRFKEMRPQVMAACNTVLRGCGSWSAFGQGYGLSIF